METTLTPDARQRVVKWIGEGQNLLTLLPGLLEESERLRGRAETLEQECERLRQENAALRKEQEDLVAAFGKLMAEMLRPMNEMMQKIRGTAKKSPFERESGPGSQSESSPVVPSGITKL